MKRLIFGALLVGLMISGSGGSAANDEVDRQILGAWMLDLTDPDGVHRAPAVVVGRQYDRYIAWYLGNDQPEPFRDVELKGDTLVGTLQLKEFPSVTLTLDATLTGDDKCAGTVKYREGSSAASGSFRFSGQRVPMSAFDEVMTWKLRFTAPDGKKHEATVTVVTKDDKRYAWFSSPDHQIPARSITVQGDNVELKLTAETEKGRPIDITFRGAVSGETVKGTAEYQIGGESGSLPFRGERTS